MHLVTNTSHESKIFFEPSRHSNYFSKTLGSNVNKCWKLFSGKLHFLLSYIPGNVLEKLCCVVTKHRWEGHSTLQDKRQRWWQVLIHVLLTSRALTAINSFGWDPFFYNCFSFVTDDKNRRCSRGKKKGMNRGTRVILGCMNYLHWNRLGHALRRVRPFSGPPAGIPRSRHMT